jgi:acyl-CoA thioester hydrolase
MRIINPFIWNSEVQENELDIQKIANNAAYLQYFDRARIEHLLSKGIDWEEWHQNGFNLVLIHVDMAIKQSLKAKDKFYVKSIYEKDGRLKIIFNQEIRKINDDKLIAKATNTLACVSVHNGKPVMPEKLLTLLFSNTVK